MNSFLERKEEGISERDIRDYNRLYLSKSKKKSNLLCFASLAVIILGIVFVVMADISSAFLIFGILFLIAGILATPYFFVRKKHFEHLLKKAKK